MAASFSSNVNSVRKKGSLCTAFTLEGRKCKFSAQIGHFAH